MITSKSIYPELPVVVPGNAGFRWFLCGNDFASWAWRAEDFLLGESATDAIEPLKCATNRIVFRIGGIDGDDSPATVVAKAFPMSTLKQRLYRYRRYGPMEVGNLLEGARRDLPVPTVWGFGLQRRLGMVLASVVLMEDIAPRLPVAELLRSSAQKPDRLDRILAIVGDVLLQLYRAGCNHIDLHHHAIWIDETLEGQPKVIDFQYVRYLRRPSLNVFMFMASSFTRLCLEFIPEPTLDAWMEEFLRGAGVKEVGRWLDLCRKYRSLRLSRACRLALK